MAFGGKTVVALCPTMAPANYLAAFLENVEGTFVRLVHPSNVKKEGALEEVLSPLHEGSLILLPIGNHWNDTEQIGLNYLKKWASERKDCIFDPSCVVEKPAEALIEFLLSNEKDRKLRSNLALRIRCGRKALRLIDMRINNEEGTAKFFAGVNNTEIKGEEGNELNDYEKMCRFFEGSDEEFTVENMEKIGATVLTVVHRATLAYAKSQAKEYTVTIQGQERKIVLFNYSLFPREMHAQLKELFSDYYAIIGFTFELKNGLIRLSISGDHALEIALLGGGGGNKTSAGFTIPIPESFDLGEVFENLVLVEKKEDSKK